MLKLGICSLQQDTPSTRLWRRGPMAATLLNEVTDPQQFNRVMTHVRLSNGTARTTTTGRFTTLHQELNPLLAAHFPQSLPLLAEDLAVSSGTVAAEWFLSLAPFFPRLRFTASDWMLSLVSIHCPDRGDTFVVEPDGTPIQYIRPPFVVQLGLPVHPLFFYNRLLRTQALARWENTLRPLLQPFPRIDPLSSRSVAHAGLSLRPVPLLGPEVHSLAAQHAATGSFSLRQHSIFSPLPTPVHLIRSMNILNLAYFDAGLLRQAIAAIHESLLPGGVWVVGRTLREPSPTVPALHHVSVLERSPKGWKPLARIGAPSEIEPLLTLE